MLKGKNILITGTNRGIGKAILEKCVENGASVWAHARRETPDFIKLVSDLSVKHQIEIRPVYFDMTDKEAVKKSDHINSIFKIAGGRFDKQCGHNA